MLSQVCPKVLNRRLPPAIEAVPSMIRATNAPARSHKPMKRRRNRMVWRGGVAVDRRASARGGPPKKGSGGGDKHRPGPAGCRGGGNGGLLCLARTKNSFLKN